MVLVGARGLLTRACLDEALREGDGWDGSSALGSEASGKLARGKGPRARCARTARTEVAQTAFPGARLIACLTPLLGEERAHKRAAVLQVTARAAMAWATRRGQDRIRLRGGTGLGRFKMAKPFELTLTATARTDIPKAQAIAWEARLDGGAVLQTSLPAQALNPPDTVRAYTQLAQHDRAFRFLKTVALQGAPVAGRRAPLATRTRHTMRRRGAAHPLAHPSLPTTVQQRACELLGLPLPT